jgi:hypothetical protein
MEKVRVGYLLQGTVDLDVRDRSVETIEETLTKETPFDVLLRGVPDSDGIIDPDQIILSSARLVEGGEDDCIYTGIQGKDIADLAAVAGTQTHRAFSVWRKLTQALLEVIQGTRDVETAFNNIPIRDCLPQHTILATTWSIDDLREHFPYGTSNEELYAKLLELENSFGNAAVTSGNDVIAYAFDEEVDNKVIIQDAWAAKDREAGFGHIYTDEDEAIEKHGVGNIVKGFSITGGHSVLPYIVEHFRDFYEHKHELMGDILKHDGLNILVSDLSAP